MESTIYNLIDRSAPLRRATSTPSFLSQNVSSPVLGSAAFPSTIRRHPKPTHRAPTAREWVGPAKPPAARRWGASTGCCAAAELQGVSHSRVARAASWPIRAQSTFQIVSSGPDNHPKRREQTHATRIHVAKCCTTARIRQTNPTRRELRPSASRITDHGTRLTRTVNDRHRPFGVGLVGPLRGFPRAGPAGRRVYTRRSVACPTIRLMGSRERPRISKPRSVLRVAVRGGFGIVGWVWEKCSGCGEMG